VKAIGRTLLAASPALWLLPPLREWVESRMSLHMLVQFPLLLAAGWAAAAGWQARAATPWRRFDARGLTSATVASAVMAFWMIPAALDAALIHRYIALPKYLSWWLAGVLLAGGWRRLGTVPAIFFLGNAAWMLVTAGLLYRETENRLCVSYLADEQATTGHGLVGLGLVLAALAVKVGAASGKLQTSISPDGRRVETMQARRHHDRIGGLHGCCGTDRSPPRVPRSRCPGFGALTGPRGRDDAAADARRREVRQQ
jgi:hypothetical protein